MERQLFVLAWLNVALHVAGLLFAAFGMQPNLFDGKLEEHLRSFPLGWSLGWVTWMLCAAALIAFLTAVVNRLPQPASTARLGLTFAIVGLGFDLLCDSVYIFVLPEFATGHTPYVFQAVERTTTIASLLIANGGYSVGILLISREMLQDPRTRPSTAAVGDLVGAGGLIMALTAFPNMPILTAVAAGPTILLFCVWVLLVARDLERPA